MSLQSPVATMCHSSLRLHAAQCEELATRDRNLRRAVRVALLLVDIGRGGKDERRTTQQQMVSVALVATSWPTPNVTSRGFATDVDAFHRRAIWSAFDAIGATIISATNAGRRR
jgi:hypothetical protein